MDFLSELVDVFMHLDEYLGDIIRDYGTLTYAILFVIVFMETGFVVTPFLPGDSLLFAAGALSTTTELNIVVLYVIFLAAAILGDTANYWIGSYVGSKVFEQDRWFLKKKYLEKTQAFYDKHGGKAIVLARFVPIVRTFAPFVAGVGTMHYLKFITYNVLGAVLWVSLFLGAGYFFGNIPVIKDNFHYTVVGIILVSLLPMAYEIWKSRREAKQEAEGANIQHMRESCEEEPTPVEVQE